MKKKLVAGALVLGSMAVLGGCGTTELDLKEFVKVEFDGVDGKGMVSNYTVDRDKLEDALKDANDDLSNREREGLMDSIELELKKESYELSNGDKVKIDIDWSERRAEKYKIAFIGDEVEVKVKGLKELKAIDAFKDIEIEYEGVSPYLSMSVKNTSDNEFLEDCYYSVEGPDKNSYNLKAGDKVKVTVNYSEYDAEEAGYTVKKDTKEIEIPEDEVDRYVEKVEQLGDSLEEFTKAGKEGLNEGIFDNSYNYTAMMSELTGAQYSWDFDMATVAREGGIEPVANEYKLDKTVVHAVKDNDDGYYKYNTITMIFSNSVKDSVNVNPVTVYYAVTLSDVVLKADGTIEYDEDNMWVSAYATSMEAIDTALDKELGSKYEIKDEVAVQ